GYSRVSINPGFSDISQVTELGMVGGTLGAHCFLADSFSIDPGFTVMYEGGSVQAPASSLGPGQAISGYIATVGVGLSGSVGHSPPHRGEEPSNSWRPDDPIPAAPAATPAPATAPPSAPAPAGGAQPEPQAPSTSEPAGTAAPAPPPVSPP